MTSRFVVEYDDGANAIYLRLKRGVVSETIELSNSILVDVNRRSEALGIEFLNPDVLGPFMRKHFPNATDVSRAITELTRKIA